MPSPPHTIFVALLLAAAVTDVRCRRIPNALVLALAASGAAASLFDATAPRFALGAAAGVVVFTVGFVLWRIRMLGGGDAKLAAAAAIWVGMPRVLTFAAVTAVAGGMLALACYATASARGRRQVRANLYAAAALGPAATVPNTQDPIFVPYGVAIALGALYTIFGVAP